MRRIEPIRNAVRVKHVIELKFIFFIPAKVVLTDNDRDRTLRNFAKLSLMLLSSTPMEARVERPPPRRGLWRDAVTTTNENNYENPSQKKLAPIE